MSALQRRLTQFLDLELNHSLGAYRHARDRLREIEKLIEDDRQMTGHTEGQFLMDLVQQMRRFNHELDVDYDASGNKSRHPAPKEMPLSQPAAFLPGAEVDSTSRQALTWVCAYYRAAIHAIGAAEPIQMDASEGSKMSLFMRALMVNRADLDEQETSTEDDDCLRPIEFALRRQRRAERYQGRLEAAIASGIPQGSLSERTPSDPLLRETADSAPESVVKTIVSSHLEARHHQPLAAFVVQALVDAHLALHEVEAYRSAPLGTALKRDDKVTEQLLQRSVALNTFVWTVSRTAPWIFAENDDERQYMMQFYPRVWRNNMPMVAMWNSAQVSLLALLRRAFAYTLLGEPKRAHNDYHKLQHNVRATLRRLHHTSIHIDGAIQFLDGLDALADHHIGGLYWADRDHGSALVHFERAHRRMERLKRETQHLVIVNSRWFVQLQLGLGKTCYELGRHKAALGWFLRAWRSLLELIAEDTSGEVHAEAIDAAIAWIDRVTDDPELHKRDVIVYVAPVVEQIEAIRVWTRFMSLASDIILRLGHLLYMLNLGDDRQPAGDAQMGGTAALHGGSLAMLCIRRAGRLDMGSTVARSDLLKLQFHAARLGEESRDAAALDREVARGHRVAKQWTGGAGRVEAFSRAVEYTLLQELRLADDTEGEQVMMARRLLHGLLTHTDSIEARRSQVHAYLTCPPAKHTVPRSKNRPAMEFICLRRYSSAYPLLPRPNGFRSHGGGYFVRCHPGGTGESALGIAIDPGTSYVECLYRAGLAISDIDVLIVTHDHVDHASSLEPLLALRWEMGQLDDNLKKPLLVIGNQSVFERWQSLAVYRDDSSVTVKRIAEDQEDIDAILTEWLNALGSSSKPSSLQLTPLSSQLSGRRGHEDIARNPAFGFVLTLRRGKASRSLALTSDLPEIPQGYDWSDPGWIEALGADVVVPHVSSVPMSELRVMADIGRFPAPIRLPDMSDADFKRLKKEHRRLTGDAAWIQKHWTRDSIVARLTYAHWLKEGRTEEEHRNQAEAKPPLPPVGGAQRFATWQAPTGHPYLGGLLQIAASYAECRGDRRGLLVIGELSEELGSFRSKIAEQVNDTLFAGGDCHAQTGDLGLRVLLGLGKGADGEVRIACSTCDLDNDLTPDERFHSPPDIAEICVKGENEGMFYNCREHDPKSSRTDPIFVEKLERYDIFGR
jgi:hypothetical protein